VIVRGIGGPEKPDPLTIMGEQAAISVAIGRQVGQTLTVSAEEIDGYLAALEEPKRTTLEALRRSILEVVPDAEQCISYGMPAFKVQGKTIAGFAAFKNRLSYLPHRGSVLSELDDEVAGYRMTKGSLHFGVDQPLPGGLVRKLVETRSRQLGLS
jgi:uncharacterized protein YdhG (YjbR/CyaY superfamily)